jgi:protease-4
MKTFFQSFLGTLFALIFVVAGVVALSIVMVAGMGPTPPVVPNNAVLVFDLNRNLPDKSENDGPAETIQKALMGDTGQDMSLPAIIDVLERASSDPKISGLFITGNLQSGGAANLLELRQALQRFKEKNKTIISYNQTWGRGELYLCAGLGEMFVNPFGAVDITAPSASLMFFKNAFDKYGGEVQVTKVGKYKSAVEPVTSDRMSKENEEQVRAYVEGIWNGIKTEIAKGRELQPEDIQRLADTKGFLEAKEAVDAKLVDQLAYYDAVLDKLKKLANKSANSRDLPQIDIETYAKIPGAPQKGTNRIAVIVAQGDIVDGEGSSSEIGGDSFARELRKLRLDRSVKAVVMRVNSPGGSVMASDVILREVLALKEAKKPVVVSMGNVAASGGYWISTYADHIFAEPATITGSIGVFGMFPNARKLANNYGITFGSVQVAKIGSPSLIRPMTAEEQARAQALVDYVYDQFLVKVSESRKKEKAAVHEIAQGRVWTGQKALELGLVDEIGGLDAAIIHAAKLANIENDYRTDSPEPPKAPMERIMDAFGKSEKRKLAKAGPFGSAQNELEAALLRMRSLNDPNGVYALAPFGVTIK